MVAFPKPLEHPHPEKKDDQALRQASQAYLANEPALQVIAELIATLRAASPGWWKPEALRALVGAEKRMAWYRQRPDLRQAITTAITGLSAKISRTKAPEFQAALIDSALDDGDVTCAVFEEAFEAADLAVYGPADELWRIFRARMPWDQDTQGNKEVVAALLTRLLAEKSTLGGMSRKPIVSAWDVRTSIEGAVWHTLVPLEIRAAIDDARFKKEKAGPREPFHAAHDLVLAAPDLLAKHLPIRNFEPTFALAESRMGIRTDAREGAAREPDAKELEEKERPTSRSSGALIDLSVDVDDMDSDEETARYEVD